MKSRSINLPGGAALLMPSGGGIHAINRANKTVNGPVNCAVRAIYEVSQMLDNIWRRVPESNRSTRICNPLLKCTKSIG
jgi:hypothetical protein